jgi:hypothetical protein
MKRTKAGLLASILSVVVLTALPALAANTSPPQNVIPEESLTKYDVLAEPIKPAGDDAKNRIRNFYIALERKLRSIEGESYSLQSLQAVRQKALRTYGELEDAFIDESGDTALLTCTDFLRVVTAAPDELKRPTIAGNIAAANSQLVAVFDSFAPEFEALFYAQCYENPLAVQQVPLDVVRQTVLKAAQRNPKLFVDVPAEQAAEWSVKKWLGAASRENVAFFAQAYPQPGGSEPSVRAPAPVAATSSQPASSTQPRAARTRTRPAPQGDDLLEFIPPHTRDPRLLANPRLGDPHYVTHHNRCVMMERTMDIQLRNLRSAGVRDLNHYMQKSMYEYVTTGCRIMLENPRY